MLSLLARSFRSLAPMFRPPFDGLWIGVLLYYFWCFLVHPQGQLLRGNLPDPDDYMYLDQVTDWLKGQGWFDNVQHRFDPPAGGPIHFSRLAEIPMAALMLLFRLVGMTYMGAATLMAVFEPLFLLAGFFLTLRWTARLFMPKEWAGVSAYVALFATGTMAMFAPGHIDHHGLVVLLVAGALGCALRMMMQPEDWRWSLGAGFLLALTLAVALEALPWIIVMSGWIGLWAIVEGRAAARGGLIYSLALYVASIAFLAVTRAPDVLLVPDMAAYSVVYVFFTGSIAVVFAGIALAGRRRAAWRWAAGIALATATGILFLRHFPELVTGPWGSVNRSVAELILDNVTEATPLAKLRGGWFKTVVAVLEPLLALGAGGWIFARARPEERWPWSLVVVLLAAAMLLTVFYQFRFIGMLGLFAVVPLTVALRHGWRWIGGRWRERRKVFAEIGLLLLVGPLPAVLVPALIDGRSFNAGVLLFPVHNDASAVCDMYGLERVLRAPQLYGGRPRLIIDTMGLGPELLFRSPHMVLSAPYHEDVDGNLDAVRFFSATDPAKAEAVARRRHAELVVACKLIPGMYTDLAAIKKALPDMDDGGAADPAKPSPPMILRLIAERALPDWLVPVHATDLGNYVVYEITPPSSARKSPER